MKKFNILLGIICMFTLVISVKAQECYTISSSPPAWIFNPSLRSAQATPSSSYTLRVFFHIVRSNNGVGLDSEIASTMLARLNSDFLNTGIQFQFDGYDFINNDTYYNDLQEIEYPLLFSTNRNNNAIDIYVLGTSTTGMQSGVAEGIPAKAYIVHGTRYNTTTLSHEMGHCLGLYHTHHGTVTETGDALQCMELVNGSNATTCGDYIIDTPADPNLWNGCNYNGSSSDVDANNQKYNPNPSNYMAYSNYTCRNMFTPQQIQRMKDFIANTDLLQNVIIPTISGPFSVCTAGATFNILNLTSGTIAWSASAGLTPTSGTGSSFFVKSLSPSGSTGNWIQAVITQPGLPTITLRQNVETNGYNPIVGPDEIYAGIKENYSVEPGAISYLWESNTLTIVQGSTSNTCKVIPSSMPGDSRLTCTVVTNCGTFTALKDIHVIFDRSESWNAYPNPVSSVLHLSSEQKLDDAVFKQQTNTTQKQSTFLVQLVSVNSGKIVLNQTVNVIGNSFDINLSSILNGIYTIALSREGSVVFTQTIVVQH